MQSSVSFLVHGHRFQMQQRNLLCNRTVQLTIGTSCSTTSELGKSAAKHIVFSDLDCVATNKDHAALHAALDLPVCQRTRQTEITKETALGCAIISRTAESH